MTSSESNKNIIGKILTYLLLALTAVLMLAPILIVISNAFKSESEIFSLPVSLWPRDPITGNFSSLADRFPLYILNSIKLTAIIVVIQVLTATTGGYVFSKMEWKGRDFIFLFYVASVMIPVQAIIIPQFLIVKNLGLYDSHVGVVLISAFTAFGTFLVKQFFMTVPQSFIEAARIDGASEFTIFRKVMIPLSGPVIATLVIFSFRYFWNDFFTPLIYLSSPELKTLPLGMADFATEYYTYVGPQMAASVISIIPVMVIFFFAQRYFVEGTMSSGVKG